MELMLDTADVRSIEKLFQILTIDGVTTNPSILCASGKDYLRAINDIISILEPEQKMFVQTISTSYLEIVAEAERISTLREKNMYVKIPVTADGLKAIKTCAKNGIGVLATAIFSSQQAFLAAMNKAHYLAPYVNRMENYCNGIQEVTDLIKMLKIQGVTSKVIAASFKNVNQVHSLILAGVDAITVPCDIAYAMFSHPGTDHAVGEFSDKWLKTYQKNCF
ncbi:MAG: hypothetical protein KBS95_01075 [Alistipes sp.]|nr:hypothetical protein [Candidatus Alistipes equi]